MLHWFRHFFAAATAPDPRDPFAHPDVAAMSPRELADLPLPHPPAAPRRADAPQRAGTTPRHDRTFAAIA